MTHASTATGLTILDCDAAPVEPTAHPHERPLPCELHHRDAVDEAPQDRAWFAALQRDWPTAVRRIPWASLSRATTPFKTGRMVVSLPDYHALDPQGDARVGREQADRILEAFRAHREPFRKRPFTGRVDDTRDAIADAVRLRAGGRGIGMETGDAAALAARGLCAVVTAESGTVAVLGPPWMAIEPTARRVGVSWRVWSVTAAIVAAGVGTALICHPGMASFGMATAILACIVVAVAGVLVPLFTMGDDDDGRWSLDVLRCALPGFIPPDARALIADAAAVAQRHGGDLRLVLEADWKPVASTVERPRAKDPLVVLIRGTDVALLGRFDCTAAEERLAREHAVRPT